VREQLIRDVTSVVSQGRGYSFIVADGEDMITHTARDAAGKTLFDPWTYGLQPYRPVQPREIERQRGMVITHPLSSLVDRYALDWAIVSVIAHDVLFDDVARLDRTIKIGRAHV